MRNIKLIKSLTVGIILLFVGVTIAQVFSENQVLSAKNTINFNLATEKTTLSCRFFTLKGIQEVKKEITVKNMAYLSSLMNSTDYSAIASEINDLGLLPNNISIEQAKELISGEYGSQYFERYSSLFGRTHLSNSEANQNYFCRINGSAESCVVSRNLIGALVAILTVYPALVLLILELLLHVLPWYPLVSFYKFEIDIDRYIDIGFAGALGYLLYALCDTYLTFQDNRIVKRGLFQDIQLEKGLYGPSAHLTTTGGNGNWSLDGVRINMFLIGFLGIWLSSSNPDKYSRLIGSALYVKAETDP